MLDDFRSYLLRRYEQLGRAIGVGDEKGQRNRRMIDILPADVEQPGNRIERADHRRVPPLSFEPIGYSGALLVRGLARLRVVMPNRLRRRRLWLILPYRLDGIGLHRHPLRACARLGPPRLTVLPPLDPKSAL